MRLWMAVGIGVLVCGLVVRLGVGRFRPAPHASILNLGSASRQNTFPKGQCTWYAYERARERGAPIRFTRSYGRDAKTWPTVVLGRRVSQVPVVGSLMVLDGWKGNPFGHVAYVESVEGASWTVTHANMGAGETMGEMDGVAIRRAVCSRLADGSVMFEGRTGHFPLIGFLAG